MSVGTFSKGAQPNTHTSPRARKGRASREIDFAQGFSLFAFPTGKDTLCVTRMYRAMCNVF